LLEHEIEVFTAKDEKSKAREKKLELKSLKQNIRWLKETEKSTVML
jgi:hypothetical protein